MAGFPKPARPRTTQPSTPARINSRLPLTRGLVFAAYPIGGSFYDAVAGQLGVANGAPTSGVNVFGRTGKFASASLQYFLFQLAHGVTGDFHTLAALCNPTNITAGRTALTMLNADSGNPRETYLRFGATSSKVTFSYNPNSTSAAATGATTLSTTGAYVIVGRERGLSSRDIWFNGVLDGTNTTTLAAPDQTFSQVSVGAFKRPASVIEYYDGGVSLAVIWNRALSDAEVRSFNRNPWQIFAPPARSIWPAAGGAATHTSTGVLVGQGSTIAGTSVHKTKHTTSGALTGAGSTVAGTSVHKTKHVTSGILTGQGSTIAGVAKRFRAHPTTGALTGPGSTVAGTAAHKTRHTTSGALTGPGAVLAGAATHSAAGHTMHSTSGALVGRGAVIAGLVVHLAKARNIDGVRRKSFRYDKWGKKKKQALKKSPEAVQIIEQVAEEYAEQPDYSWLAKAVAQLERELAAEHIKAARVYVELLELEHARLAHESDEDDELLLL